MYLKTNDEKRPASDQLKEITTCDLLSNNSRMIEILKVQYFVTVGVRDGMSPVKLSQADAYAR